MLTKDRIFGADPEFGVYLEHYSDGTHRLPYIIPPAALIDDFGAEFKTRKDKEKIRKVFLKMSEGSVIEDGAAIELNLTPVRLNEAFLLYSSVSNLLESFISKVGQIHDDLYFLSWSPDQVGYFDLERYWKGRGENFQMCVVFGCDPDVSPKTYKLMGLEDKDNVEIDVTNHSYRYFGGHLHIQNMSNFPHIYEEQQEFAPIMLDFTVGMLNAAFLRKSSQRTMELKRLEYYGRPGRVRFQEYPDNKNGIEYRPLSNYWLQDSGRASAIFKIANLAASAIEDGMTKDFFIDFREYIPEMWKTMLTLESQRAKDLLTQSLAWFLNTGYIPMTAVEDTLSFIETMTG